MKRIDMYGEPIKFSYKNSHVFSTCCGLSVSFIVASLIICYSVLLILDVVKMDLPRNLNTPVTFYDPPLYRCISDFKSAFNSTAEEPLDDIHDNNTGVLQLSFGYADKIQWLPLDPTEAVLVVENVFHNHSEILYIDTCKRYPYVSNTTANRYGINSTYCLYSSFETKGSQLCEEFSYLQVSLKACKNDTYVYKKRKDLVSYKRLYHVFTASNEQNQSNPFNLDWRKYEESVMKLNKDYDDYNGYGQLYVEPASLSNDTEMNYVVCKTQKEIATILAQRTLALGYHATILNQTSVDKPVVRYFELKDFQLGMSLMTNAQIYFQKDEVCTFDSVLPKSIVQQNNSIYYFNVNEDLFKTVPGDYDGENIIQILIVSSNNMNHNERTYRTIFDILGLIGGLNKIFMVVGGIFVYKIAYIRMKESLINEFYSVIDPENVTFDKVRKSFTQFLQELNCKDPNKQVSDKQKVLESRFDQERVRKLLEIENKQDRTHKERLSYNLAKLIYHTYKYKIYSGFSFTYFEIVSNLICCSCCISERLKRKRLTFEKAVAQLEEDTDFLSILKCVQVFENIKSVFFKKDTQLNLFNALANKFFMAGMENESAKMQMEEEERKQIETNNEQMDKEFLTLKSKNTLSNSNSSRQSQIEFNEKNLDTLCNSIWSLIDKKQMEEFDEKLLKNLIVLDKSHGNIVEEIIFDIKKIISESHPNKDEQNIEKEKEIHIFKENLDFLNSKYGGKK